MDIRYTHINTNLLLYTRVVDTHIYIYIYSVSHSIYSFLISGLQLRVLGFQVEVGPFMKAWGSTRVLVCCQGPRLEQKSWSSLWKPPKDPIVMIYASATL